MEQTTYKGFPEFKKAALLAIVSVYKCWAEAAVNRMGLRYVNNINVPSRNGILAWSKYINSNLLAPLKVFSDSENLSRFLIQTEMRGEDYRSRVTIGIPNPDYPGLIRQRDFLIDIDIYTKEALGESDIVNNLDKYHEIMIQHFESSITMTLRNYMAHE